MRSAFIAYLDASGTDHDQPVLAVAGFVALAEQWVEFEPPWKRRLEKDGLEFFHMSEVNRKFKGRSDERKQLLQDLAQIVEFHVGVKVGCCVVNEGVAQIPESDRRRWHMNAYSLAGRSCAAQIRLWGKSWGAPPLAYGF